jgi:hypothetical protein
VELADEPDLFQIASPKKAGKTDMVPHAGSVPEGEMTVNRLADLVGRTRHINTIDVSTQSEGPIYTMDEWATYFASPTPRKPLLNVVSLDLANTKLHDLV